MTTNSRPRILFLLLVLFVALLAGSGPTAALANDANNSAPRLASDTNGNTNNSTPPVQAPIYTYISCPIEIYRGTTSANAPAEYLVDDFTELPERWLYVLTPLDSGENYFFTLDLACRTQNTRFEGQISAAYHNYLRDDGSLGTLRIEVAEELSPGVFVVYYGELKYIADGDLHLVQTDDARLYNHHLLYFTLATADPDSDPLSEQRAGRLIDAALFANFVITGHADCPDNVYDTDLLKTDYMYPYHKYDTEDAMDLTGGRHFIEDDPILVQESPTQTTIIQVSS